VVNEHGMRSGENLAKELMFLESCKWLDSLLPSPDQKFLANCCANIRNVINKHIKEKSTELHSIINGKFSLCSSSSFKFIEKIGVTLP